MTCTSVSRPSRTRLRPSSDDAHAYAGSRLPRPGLQPLRRRPIALPVLKSADALPIRMAQIPASVRRDQPAHITGLRSRLGQRLEVSRVDLLGVSLVVGHLIDRCDGGAPSSHVLVRPRVVRPGGRTNLDLRPFGHLARISQQLRLHQSYPPLVSLRVAYPGTRRTNRAARPPPPGSA